jgi:hypothetical protein
LGVSDPKSTLKKISQSLLVPHTHPHRAAAALNLVHRAAVPLLTTLLPTTLPSHLFFPDRRFISLVGIRGVMLCFLRSHRVCGMSSGTWTEMTKDEELLQQ